MLTVLSPVFATTATFNDGINCDRLRRSADGKARCHAGGDIARPRLDSDIYRGHCRIRRHDVTIPHDDRIKARRRVRSRPEPSRSIVGC